MQLGLRLRRPLWFVVIFLAFIGVAVAARRLTHVLPIALRGYHPPSPSASGVAAQFTGIDDIFARHPYLKLIHIILGILFMLLGPLQFNSSIRARHLQWHRWNGRVFFVVGLIIGFSALTMSLAMPAIGGVNQAAA